MKKLSSIIFFILMFLLFTTTLRIIGHYMGGIAALFFGILVIAGVLLVAYIVRPGGNRDEVRGIGTRIKERLESSAARHNHTDTPRVEPLDLYVSESKYDLSPEESKQWDLIEETMINNSYDEPLSIPKFFKKRKKKDTVSRIM